MKKGFFQTSIKKALLVLAALTLPVLASASQKQSELKSIEFKQAGEVSELHLTFDGNEVQASKFHISEDKQIIIDLKNVKSTKRVMQAFDTSEFSGSIIFVSAYKKPNEPNSLRVTLQLRDNVRSFIKRRPNEIIVEVENRFGVFTQKTVSENKTFEDKTRESVKAAGKLLVPKSESVEDILENLTLSGRKRYIGKKISFNVKDVSIEDLLKMIADSSGFNIIITDEIRKLVPLTLNLTNVPWDQALDTILGLNKLVATKNGIILMVQTLQRATADRKIEVEAKKVAQREEPLVTKVFPISYATTGEMSKILIEYLTAKRGRISLDERTNSLIIKDTPDVIEKMRKIIEVLDTQTPQVLIESKIVEVNESYSKEIGLGSGINFGYDPVGSTDSVTNAGPGFTFSSAPVPSGSIFGVKVGRFNRLLNLGFTLQLMEQESKGKVVSSPKVITQNKKEAQLGSKLTTSYEVVTGTGTDRQVTYQEVTAELFLKVTPQVTNEGSIALAIDLKREVFTQAPSPGAPPNKTERAVKTNVLVENGSTIVLGGLYQYNKRENHSGIPFLKDLPLVGWLFRSAYNPATIKEELVIFLTPRIINQESAGLSGGS